MNSSDLISRIRRQSTDGCFKGVFSGKVSYSGVFTGTVLFNTYFETLPVVTLTQFGGTTSIVLRLTEVTNTQFTWVSTGVADFTLHWMAILPS